MRMRTTVAMLVLASAPAWAQVRVGPEFQVNTYVTGAQMYPAIASDADGAFVVAWQSADGDDTGVFARRYQPDGTPIGGSEFRVNAYTTGTQSLANLAADADGDLVVVWSSFGQDGSGAGVFGRRYDANGAIAGAEFRANTYTAQNQVVGRVSAAADGRFVAVWVSLGQAGPASIFGQRFDASGLPVDSEFRANSYLAGGHGFPRVAVAPAGDFVVAWQSYGQDGHDFGIHAQRYDAGGAKLGGEFRVNVHTFDSQAGPAVAMQADGSFVVVWHTEFQDGSGYGIMGRRFDALGAPVGGEFLVNEHTTGHQFGPAIAADGAGAFVVTWASRYQDGSNDGVFGRRFDASGPQGPEFRINSFITGKQTYPVVASQADGRFVVVWQSAGQDGSDYGVFGQRLEPDVIFKDDFETGSLAAWSSAATDGGDLSVSADAALNLSAAGLRAVVDDTAGLFVQDDRPRDEGRYRARFYFDPNGFDPGTAQAHLRTRVLLVFEEAPNRRLAAVVLRRLSNVYSLMLRCRLDDNSQDNGGFFTISDAPHAVELDWKRSSGTDASDGSCRLSIDGVEVSARTGLDNSISGVDFVRMGALSVKTGATGAMHWDEFESRRLNPIGP